MTDEKLYDLCRDAARITGRLYQLSDEEMEDLQSMAFIKFKKSKLRSDHIPLITDFVKRICIDEFRKLRNMRAFVEKSTDRHLEGARKHNPLHAIEMNESIGEILGCLPDDWRDAVIIDGLGYSGRESADILGISHSAFKCRLLRGRKQIKLLEISEPI